VRKAALVPTCQNSGFGTDGTHQTLYSANLVAVAEELLAPWQTCRGSYPSGGVDDNRPPMFSVPNGLNVVPSPLNRRRCENEDSSGRAAETNTRTCEHNGKSAAIRESIVLPRQRFPYQRDQALRSATVWQACQCSPSSYDDGAADGTTGLAGHKIRALVRGEAAFSTSVPARSADNGPGIHMAKIAVGA